MNSLSGQVIENAASGELIVIQRTGLETGGRLLAFELRLAPGGRVPASHLHPEQEERFTVVEGQLTFRLGRKSLVVSPGETVTVHPGTPHRFANAGPGQARVLVEVRPALRMEELLETAASLGATPRPLHLALFLREFGREVRAPLLPGLVNAVVHALAWVAATSGLGAGYLRARS
jgi:quercetin dioxygenase-like cupin family protein